MLEAKERSESTDIIVAKMSKDVEHVIYLLEKNEERMSCFEKRIVLLEHDAIPDGEPRLRSIENKIGQIFTVGGVLVFVFSIAQFVLSKYF